MVESYFYLFLAGAIGALIKDLVQDNTLRFPRIRDGSLYMGFIGGAIIGGFVGVVVDHNYITAALAGYTGVNVIEHLLRDSIYAKSLRNNTTSRAGDHLQQDSEDV